MQHTIRQAAVAGFFSLAACTGTTMSEDVTALDASDAVDTADANTNGDTVAPPDAAPDGDDVTAPTDGSPVDVPMGDGGITDRLRTTPYVPLGAIGQDQDAIALAINRGDPGAPTADDLARWFRYYDDRGLSLDTNSTVASRTLGQRLLASGMHLSQYINGSYSGSDDLTEVETSIPLGISTYWCGQPRAGVGSDTSPACRLPSALAAADTSIVVNLPTGTALPAGAPAAFPFRASTTATANAHSIDGRTFVSFVRIDDELIEIRAIGARGGTSTAPTLRLDVLRGLWGTTPTAHASNARVLTPIYIGGASGLGAGQSCPDPTGSNDIRYALRIHQGSSSPRGDVVQHLIDRVRGRRWTSYDSIFLDCSPPSFFNQTDGYCLSTIEPWNDRDPANPHLTTEAENGTDQGTKISALRAAAPTVRDVANNWNVNSRSDFDIRMTGIRAAFADGYVFEAWNDGLGRNSYAATLDAHLAVQNEQLPAIYLQKTSARDTIAWPTAEQFQRWIYGNYLLAYRLAPAPSDPRALPPILLLDIGLAQPAGMYFWDLGEPSGTPGAIPAAGATDHGLSQPTAGIFVRTFANGVVVVNASASAATVPVTGELYDVTASSSAPPLVTGGNVMVASHDARVLVSP